MCVCVCERTRSEHDRFLFSGVETSGDGRAFCTTTPTATRASDKQFCFHWRCIPDPGSNEVVQLVAFAQRKPLRHRLNALAIARTDQPRHVEGAHLSPRIVSQPIQKRLEKVSKLFFLI